MSNAAGVTTLLMHTLRPRESQDRRDAPAAGLLCHAMPLDAIDGCIHLDITNPSSRDLGAPAIEPAADCGVRAENLRAGRNAREEHMFDRIRIGAATIALAAALMMTTGGAPAADDPKYPIGRGRGCGSPSSFPRNPLTTRPSPGDADRRRRSHPSIRPF
jgi:hypothetical protein